MISLHQSRGTGCCSKQSIQQNAYPLYPISTKHTHRFHILTFLKSNHISIRLTCHPMPRLSTEGGIWVALPNLEAAMNVPVVYSIEPIQTKKSSFRKDKSFRKPKMWTEMVTKTSTAATKVAAIIAKASLPRKLGRPHCNGYGIFTLRMNILSEKSSSVLYFRSNERWKMIRPWSSTNETRPVSSTTELCTVRSFVVSSSCC